MDEYRIQTVQSDKGNDVFNVGDKVLLETRGAGVSSYELHTVGERSETMLKLEDYDMVFEDRGKGVWSYRGDFGFSFYVLPRDDAKGLAFLAEEDN